MPSLSTLTTFVLVVAAFAAVPGPSNLYVTAQGLRGGRRVALAAALGCALAAAAYAVATTFGLAALLASSAPALSALHYLGGAYLLFLGVRAWRAGGRIGEQPPAQAASDERDIASRRRRAFVQGVVVELSNPKVALFFLAFFPQFVHRGSGSVTGQLVVLGAVFCVVGLLSDSIYALLAGALRQRIGSSRRLLGTSTRASGVLYLGLGGWSIWSGARVRAQ
ncbi:Threonine/homoserine/homoserine lactone efflux protein [Jatrophihabitans endophyticus]|uniref:Threonine/homoserine/homoserine lactone efflux protein n=1 Tax=Jatrophihabitans endophyticus TaxID=1206085 RepID=A0A1M5ITF7_9ACTN|nr:LysE family translocator [Jatrophihabitans endophyticus]SHG31250.1 Threonine/homoserine/homoserine lactone efflux protein [Jatrophihabitans endophyticus]